MSRPVVAAVDWGTTRMRVWLLGADGAVLGEKRSDEGMLAAAGIGFRKVLDGRLADLDAPAELPVIMAGMVGARQGWVEAPYAFTPARLDAVLGGAIRVPDAGRDARIVPGVAQGDRAAPDVMRGEETQLAGIEALRRAGQHVVCMPGTHSKWVNVRDGAVTGFSTWMTGEMFSILSQHSVLKHSVGGGALAFQPDSPAFAEGVTQGLEQPERLTSLAFGVRAATLLHKLPSEDASARLSGLLIGAEIAAARKLYPASGPVILVGSGLMYELYRRGLETAGLDSVQADADLAVRNGLLEAARQCGMVD